jgi:hypothetical protein
MTPAKVAEALWISEEDVVREFSDGRVTSRFGEIWAGKLYEFNKCENTNESGYDGLIEHPLVGRIRVGVRSLTKSGIKFQMSKFTGSGRTCTIEDLRTSIAAMDFEIVMDIVDSPIVHMVPVKAEDLMGLVTAGELTPSGLNRSSFYRKVFGIDVAAMEALDFIIITF